MASKEFMKLLDKCREIHIKKNHDYARDNDPFSNFKRAATIVSWFKNPEDQTFAALVGIKIARLAELLNGKEPLNESRDDSFLDQACYTLLWAAYHIEEIMDDDIETPFLATNEMPKFEPMSGFICNGCLREFHNHHAITWMNYKFHSVDCLREYDARIKSNNSKTTS